MAGGGGGGSWQQGALLGECSMSSSWDGRGKQRAMLLLLQHPVSQHPIL